MTIEKLFFPLCGETLNTFLPGYSDYAILCSVVAKVNEIIDYSKNMTIKYADPIEWDITTQYSANTVVVDGSGNAYLSVQPVPDGIQLSDTDYWTKIGNFDELWRGFKRAISLNDEGAKTTASKEYVAGELVWLNNTLYKVNTTMPIGTEFVIGDNVNIVTVEELLDALGKDFSDKLNKEISDREEADSQINQTITEKYNDLSNKLATETNERQEGDASLNNKIDETEAELQGNIDKVSDDLEQAKEEILGQFESTFAKLDNYANVKNYGAVGNGSTDDTQAFKDAIASGKDIFVPDGEFLITQSINLGSPLMAGGGVILASGSITISFDSLVAPTSLHFKSTGGAKYNPTKGAIIGDWFINNGLSDVFRGGVLNAFSGTIFFPTKGSWGAANNKVTTTTPYHLSNKVYMDSHVRYDFCGGVISFDSATACISASQGAPERSYLVNATLCATDESVAQFTEVVDCGRIFFDSFHCIGGRRVGFYKNTVNVQVSNVVHDVYYTSSAGYCSYVLDETSGGSSGISGNASIRFYNCISSFSGLTGDSSQFIIYNSNDIRDIFIDDCECASPSYGIQINSSGDGVTAWNIFIRNYVADQCTRCIYCTNLGRGQVTIDSGYFNAHDRCIEFINSTGAVTNSFFLGDRQSVGIAVTNSQGAIITGNQFLNIDHPIVLDGGSACEIGFNTVNRKIKYSDDYAIKLLGASNGNRLICNSIIPATTDVQYTAGFRFESSCSGNIVGLNRVTGTELSNEEADLKIVATSAP